MADGAELRLAFQRERAAELESRLLRLLPPLDGTERVLDSGCGTGALAAAVAPHVAEVVGIDADGSYVEAARAACPANCTFLVGDAAALPFGYAEFDVGGCLRVLHHVRRPELVVAELARVTRPGGIVLVVDQLGAVDPIVSLEIDRFERARDPSHQRLLPDADIRGLLDANDLVVLVNETTVERRDMARYLELAGVTGPERERLQRVAPDGVREVEVGWYVARKPGG
jgi:ubiquinone/menaquinone biosynthesis C-methylase UbiE